VPEGICEISASSWFYYKEKNNFTCYISYFNSDASASLQNFAMKWIKSNEGIQKFPFVFMGQKVKVQNTKIWFEFFQTGFLSCDRWQYSGSLL